MRAELDQLWLHERPRVTQEVSDAAAQGDRSENAEYIYGKRRLREIDHRVRFLIKRLEAVKVVVEAPTDPARIYFGAWVTVRDNDGDRKQYRIVGPDESDVDRGWISMDAPLATSLMGKQIGDVVTVLRPKGAIELEVDEVSYVPPEACAVTKID
jgi:transcription elongation factor GreB